MMFPLIAPAECLAPASQEDAAYYTDDILLFHVTSR
jgi:hypothetical protein